MAEKPFRRSALTTQPLTSQILRATMQQAFEYRGVTHAGRRHHYLYCKYFFAFVKEVGFTRDILRKYKQHLCDRNDIKLRTKNNYLSTAGIFLWELTFQGMLTSDMT